MKPSRAYIPKWRYTRGVKAHYQYKDGTETFCVIPDSVSDNQKQFDGKKIQVSILTPWGRKYRYGILRGDLYGLNTSGTGDIIVTPVKRG